jgi:hypothetical protein
MIAQESFDSIGAPDFGESASGERTDAVQQAEDSAGDDYDDTRSDYDSRSDQGSGDYRGDD